jgi:hypothetical protein
LQQEISAFAATLFIELASFRQTADDKACPTANALAIAFSLAYGGEVCYNRNIIHTTVLRQIKGEA